MRGIDLSRELDDATFAAIKKLFDSNGMICFRGQSLTPASFEKMMVSLGAVAAAVGRTL